MTVKPLLALIVATWVGASSFSLAASDEAQDPAVIRGTLLEASGRPVAAGTMKLIFVSTGEGGRKSAAVGADGAFEVSLPPGVWDVKTQPPRCAPPIRLTVPISTATDAAELPIRLQLASTAKASTVGNLDRPGAAANTLIDVVELITPKRLEIGIERGKPTALATWERERFQRVDMPGLPGGIVLDTRVCQSTSPDPLGLKP
jgi:hypothetical protein